MRGPGHILDLRALVWVEKYWPLLVKTWPAYERFFAATHERAIFVLRRR